MKHFFGWFHEAFKLSSKHSKNLQRHWTQNGPKKWTNCIDGREASDMKQVKYSKYLLALPVLFFAYAMLLSHPRNLFIWLVHLVFNSFGVFSIFVILTKSAVILSQSMLLVHKFVVVHNRCFSPKSQIKFSWSMSAFWKLFKLILKLKSKNSENMMKS